MKTKILALLTAVPLLGFGQLVIEETGQTYLINFDETVDSVNAGPFKGYGFSSDPSSGTLDAEAWAYTAMNGDKPFGAENTGGHAARSNSGGDVTADGFYSFNISAFGSDNALGWQSSEGVFDPGTLTLMLINQTDSLINNFRFGYTFASLNNTSSSVQVSVEYSFDDQIYDPLPSLTKASEGTSASGGWSTSNQDTLVSGISWSANDTLYIQFTSQDPSGSATGEFDEIAIDNIFIIGYDVDYLWNGTAWEPSDPSGKFENATALVLAGDTATLSGSTVLKGISVNPNAKLYIPDGSDLTISDFGRFEADATGYAQLYGEIIGTVSSFETYLESDGGRWFNLAFPVSSIVDSIKGIPIEAGGDPRATNIWKYDASADPDNDGEGEFVPVSSVAEQTHLIGYQVYAGDTTYFGQAPFTVYASGGTFINGDAPVDVSDFTAEDWNLLPNPYPSIIDFVDVENDLAVGGTYYIQEGTPDLDTNVNTNISWRTYNVTSDLGTFGGTRYIAPGQSYFVQYLGGDPTITFTNSMRELEVSPVPDNYKTSKPYKTLSLIAVNLDKNLPDKTVLMFDASFDDNMDRRTDGVKMMNTGYPNLYTHLNQKDYTYNGISDQFTSRTLDLYFQGDYDGYYEIKLDLDAVPTDWTLELEDVVTNNIVDLRKSTYLFQHNSSNSEDRFKLHINKNNVGLAELKEGDIFSYLQDNTLAVSMQDVEKATVRVYDVKGQLLLEEGNVSQRFETNINSWASGVYLITVQSANGTKLFENKVVKTQ